MTLPVPVATDPAAMPARTVDSSDRRFFVRMGGLALIVALSYLVFLIVQPVWQPLVWAALLGAVLAPWNARLSARLGNRPRIASAITTVMTVLFFVLPLAAIAGTVVAQAAQLLRKLDSFRPSTGANQQVDLTDFPWLARPLAWIGQDVVTVTFVHVRGDRYRARPTVGAGGPRAGESRRRRVVAVAVRSRVARPRLVPGRRAGPGFARAGR